MHSGAGPGHRVNDGSERVRLAVGGIGRGPLVKRCRVEGGPRQHALGNAQEGGHVGSNRDVRALGRCRKAWLHVDVGPFRRGTGDAVSVGRDLSEARPQHENRVGFLEPVEHGVGGAQARHTQV